MFKVIVCHLEKFINSSFFVSDVQTMQFMQRVHSIFVERMNLVYEIRYCCYSIIMMVWTRPFLLSIGRTLKRQPQNTHFYSNHWQWKNALYYITVWCVMQRERKKMPKNAAHEWWWWLEEDPFEKEEEKKKKKKLLKID